MLQRERMPARGSHTGGASAGGNPRGGGGDAGRQMPVSTSGYEAVADGASCVHFVVCDETVELPGRIDAEVAFTDYVLSEPFALVVSVFFPCARACVRACVRAFVRSCVRAFAFVSC